MNIYQRRDGRFEGRISRESEATVQGNFSISLARQRRMSVRKWRKNAVKNAIVR